VIYKGSGFYTTDYGRPKPPADNGKETKDTSESKTSTPAETKSETTGAKTETTSKTSTAASPSSESKT
jgi:hypothetical protein